MAAAALAKTYAFTAGTAIVATQMNRCDEGKGDQPGPEVLPTNQRSQLSAFHGHDPLILWTLP